MSNETESPEAPAAWHLRGWLAERGKTQADMVRELDWDRARVSRLASGAQPYTRNDLASVSGWLRVEPHELLMKPSEAEFLRRLRMTAQAIAEGLSAEQLERLLSRDDIYPKAPPREG